MLVFTDEFAIEELNFESGANLNGLGECYIPDGSAFVDVNAGVSEQTASLTISLTAGDEFYMRGRMNLDSARGVAADAGDGTLITFSTTAGLTPLPGGGAPADADDMDNCTLVSNADQRDTNGDGYGNICDPDLNNDGTVNFIDIATWSAFFNMPTTGDKDFNGDGVANFLDFTLISDYFLGPPGPSGVAP